MLIANKIFAFYSHISDAMFFVSEKGSTSEEVRSVVSPIALRGSWGLATWGLILLYVLVVVLLSFYGLHRGALVWACWRHRAKLRTLEKSVSVSESELPHVTVQLPLFNEAMVAERLIEQCALLDYPHPRLEIQVLDDSTDETQNIARVACERLAASGLDIRYIHRTHRVGYKAGALAEGLKSAKGELIAIFDADFIPQPDFIKTLVGHFKDPQVACVQSRWGHLNREQSLLTSIQALMLDGHHLVENRARFGSNCLFNFSGTGGMWRLQAIEDAGGWAHDTVTEDLDLSYRAQLKGWKFIYRADVVTPSELPEEMSAFRAQQFRWAKGTVQNARKLLHRVWAAPQLRFSQKIEATYHLTPHFTSPLMVVLSLLLLPMFALLPGADPKAMFLIDLPLAASTLGSLSAFYMHAERAQGRSCIGALKRLPALMALGAGMAPWVSRAVFEGLRSMAGEFVRTPKKGGTENSRYKAKIQLPILEYAFAIVSFLSVLTAIRNGHWFAAPFAGLFSLGYAYVAGLLTYEQIVRYRAVSKPALLATNEATLTKEVEQETVLNPQPSV